MVRFVWLLKMLNKNEAMNLNGNQALRGNLETPFILSAADRGGMYSACSWAFSGIIAKESWTAGMLLSAILRH